LSSWRRTVKWVGLGVAVVVLVATLVGYLLSLTGLYQDWARRYALSTIEDRLRVQASLGPVGGNPIYRISAQDLVLTREGEPVFRAKQVHLSYFLPQLLFGKPVVSVDIEDFDLAVIRTEAGWNISNILKPSKKPGAAVIRSLSLQRGRVTYVAAPGARPTVISNINAEGSVAVPPLPNQPVVMELRRASLSLAQPRVTLRQLSGTISYGGGQAKTDLSVDVDAEGGHFEATLKAAGAGGELANLRASGSLVLRRFAFGQPGRTGGLKEGKGAVDFALEGGKLTVSGGKIEAPAARTTFGGTLNGLAGKSATGMRAHLQGSAEVRDLAAVTGRPDLAGSMAGTYRLSAARARPGAAPTGQGSITISSIDLTRVRPGGLRGRGAADFSLAGGTLTVSRGEITLPGASTNFSGTVTGVTTGGGTSTAGAMAADIRGKGRVSDLARVSGKPNLAGTLAGTYRLKVTPGRHGAETTEQGVVDLSSFRLPRVRPGGVAGSGTADFALAGDTLTLNRAKLSTNLASGTFSGTVRGVREAPSGSFSAQGQGSADVPNLAAVSGRPDWAGGFTGTYRLSAATDRQGRLASAKGTLDLSRFRLARLRGGVAGSGTADFALAGDTLTLNRAKLSTNLASGTFSGTVRGVREAPSGPFSAQAQGSAQINDLARLSGRPTLTGWGSVTFNVKATRRLEARQMTTSLAVSAHAGQAQVKGYAIDAASIEASYQTPLLKITSFTASSRRLGQLSLSGTAQPRALDLAYRASSPDIGGLASRLGATKIATGSLSTEGRASGTQAGPTLQGSFSGQGLSYGDYGAAKATGSYQVADVLAGRTGKLSASLTDLQAKGRRFTSASLTATLPQRGSLTFTAEGQEEAQVNYRAQGSLSGLGQPRTQVDLSSFQAVAGRLDVRNTRPLAIIMEGQTTRLPQVALAATDNSLTVTGSAEAPGAVGLRLKFNNVRTADLTRLVHVNFPLQGTLTGQATVGGTTARPVIKAAFTARNGAIGGVPFSGLTADVDYATEVADITGKLTPPVGPPLAVKGTLPVKVTLMPPAISAASGHGLLQGLVPKLLPKGLEKVLPGLGL
jgi:hypothetical protein